MSGVAGGDGGRFGGRRDFAKLASNAASLAVLAFAGIILNAILAGSFGVGSLGQFNKLVALHLVISQLTVFGIHLSCLHYLGAASNETRLWEISARTAVVAVLAVGSVFAMLLTVSAETVAKILNSPNLAAGIYWLAPAVALFGLNKVLMSLYNTTDRLHALALLQALRPIAWLIGAAVLVRLDKASSAELGQLLFFGELAATLPGLILLPRLWRGCSWADLQPAWFRRHLKFGLQAMPSHLIIVLNTRIDVLVLAYFATDAIVGVYSFVALLAEGVFQIGVVIRTVINNRLVSLLLGRDQARLQILKKQAGRWSLSMSVVASLLLYGGFVPLLEWLGLDTALAQGNTALGLLLVGVVACAFHSPFWMALVLAGHPVQHSQLMLALCALNLAVNIALIPFLGMLGAAIGTAIMLAAFPWLLSWSVKRVLAVRL